MLMSKKSRFSHWGKTFVLSLRQTFCGGLMLDSVLQMAPWGQPMATGKAHVLLSGPWVTMSEP